jgi:hypothetical protein
MAFDDSNVDEAGKETVMTAMEWILWSFLVAIYVVCLFTVCSLTFRKGHTALGIIGIFLPSVWGAAFFMPCSGLVTSRFSGA